MRPLIANVFDVSPWQRIKASLFPNKKNSKIVKDRLELQCNIVMDLANIERNKESVNRKGFVSGKDRPFSKVLIKGKNTRLWRVYFFGPRQSYVAFPLPFESTICVHTLLGRNGCRYWIDDVYCNHDWIFELPEKAEEYKYIYDWLYKNTNYHAAYNSSLTTNSQTIYKVNNNIEEVEE